MKGYIVTNSSGVVVATFTPGGATQPTHCPIGPPPDGAALEMEIEDVDTVAALMKGGQQIIVENGEVKVAGVTIATIFSEMLQ